MNNYKNTIYILILLSLMITSSGCATYKTLDNVTFNSPKVFSGTRLDLHAINKNKVALKKFKVNPPEYPLLDLPGSFVLDVVAAPATLGLTAYEALFY